MKFAVLVTLCFIAAVHSSPYQKLKPSANINARIIGGIVAQPAQFPWQVAVYLDRDDGSFFCGGSLTHPRWVLTAGHCVAGANVFTLHVGSSSLVDPDANRLEYKTSYWIVHPNYDPATLVNNIGLIQIFGTVPSNEFVHPIGIWEQPIGSGSTVTVSGWGATGNWNGAVNYLNHAALTAISNEECQAIYGNFITSDNLCAVGKNSEGVCSGDVGGALTVPYRNGGFVQVGIVSWALSEGCDAAYPSVFVRISSYIGWINNNTIFADN